MALRAASLLASVVAFAAADTKAVQHLQALESNVNQSRKDFRQSLSKMAAKHAELSSTSKNSSKLDELAGEVESRVTLKLDSKSRKALEQDYDKQVRSIRTQNASDAKALQTVAAAEAAAEKDLNMLRDADREDARNLRTEFSKARRDAHGMVRDLARSGRNSLHLISPTGVEEAMEKADKSEKSYDRAEDRLESEKDRYMDQVDSLHDQMDDLVEDVYGKVHERLEARLDALEQDEAARREQRRQTLREAAETLRMSGSLSRVEEKLHRLESKMQGQSEELAGSSRYMMGTNAVCTFVIAIGLVVSLVMNVIERRQHAARSRLSMPINQPESFGYERA
jgi:hypothetical protein